MFGIPKGGVPEQVHFTYDDTGQGGPGGENEKHARFRWSVPPG